jgi:hypothetical protein
MPCKFIYYLANLAILQNLYLFLKRLYEGKSVVLRFNHSKGTLHLSVNDASLPGIQIV